MMRFLQPLFLHFAFMFQAEDIGTFHDAPEDADDGIPDISSVEDDDDDENDDDGNPPQGGSVANSVLALKHSERLPCKGKQRVQTTEGGAEEPEDEDDDGGGNPLAGG